MHHDALLIAALLTAFSSCVSPTQDLDSAANEHVISAENEPLPRAEDVWAIVHADIIVGDGHTIIEDGHMIISGNKILSVGTFDQMPPKSEMQTFDATGLTVLPGLIDAHFHLDRHKKNLPAHFINHGVTSVRDPGAWIEDYDSVRIHTETISRLFLTGPHFDMFPPAYPKNSYILRNPMEAKIATEKFIAQGASAIKIYFRSTLPIIRSVCETADRFEIPVTAHLEITDIFQAVRQGLDGIEHITSLGFNLVSAQHAEAYKQAILRNNDARRAGRYSMWEEINPHGAQAFKLAQFLAEHQVFVCPTLGAFEYQGDETFTDSLRQKAFENMLTYTGILHETGVKVVVGSHGWVQYDAFGWAFHHEMELFQKAGIPPLDIIHAATLRNAHFLNIDDRLGSLEIGKIADLIMIQGNPLNDIKQLRKVTNVVLNGKLIHSGNQG